MMKHPVCRVGKVVSTAKNWFSSGGTIIVCATLLAGVVSSRAAVQSITLQPGYNFVDSQIVGSGGNTLDNTAFLTTPTSANGLVYYQWECTNGSFEAWSYSARSGSWIPTPGAVWDPGQGAIINNPLSSPITLTLTGTTTTPTYPPEDYCGCGTYALLGSVNGTGTFQSILGFNPVAGSQVFIYNPASGPPNLTAPPSAANYTVYTYLGGAVGPRADPSLERRTVSSLVLCPVRRNQLFAGTMSEQHCGNVLHQHPGVLRADGHGHCLHQLDRGLHSAVRLLLCAEYHQPGHMQRYGLLRREQQLHLYHDRVVGPELSD